MNMYRPLSCAVTIGALVVLTTLAPDAMANYSDGDVLLRVHARNSVGEGTLEFTLDDGWWNGGNFYLHAAHETVYDAEGGTIATFFIDSVCVNREGPAFPLLQVLGGFAVQAGSLPTLFELQSELLSFGAIANPEGKATVGLTVTDSNGDGATLTGYTPNGGAYLAQYNGFVPNGTTFAEAIGQVVAGAFDVASADYDSGWLPIVGDVTSVSAEFGFVLTPGDLATGTSNFQITPEPASLLVLAAGLLLLRARAR